MRHVVLLRCGKSSLHKAWLADHGTARDFELVLSYFDAEAYAHRDQGDGIRSCLIPGGKWDGIAKTIAHFPDLLEADYIWLPDDDLATDCATINRLFALAKAHGLTVCQPALSRDSYYSHLHLLQCDGMRMRFTNSIEVMAPCLDRATLKACLPLMEAGRSGFGLDWIWTQLEGSDPRGGAILDCIPIRHTRPIGTSLAKSMTAAEIRHEEMLLLKQVGLTRQPYSLCHGAMTDQGKQIMSQLWVGYQIWATTRRHKGDYLDWPKVARDAIKLLRRHIFRREKRLGIRL